MSRCFRAILSHWAETPEEVSEGRWSKSDSKQRRIDVAAVGMDVAAAPSVTESRLLLQPKLEPRVGRSSPNGSCRCWQSSRRLARFARPRVDELPSRSMRASVNPRGGGRYRYCPGRAAAVPLAAGMAPTSAPAAPCARAFHGPSTKSDPTKREQGGIRHGSWPQAATIAKCPQ